jgi:hypothetical protein
MSDSTIPVPELIEDMRREAQTEWDEMDAEQREQNLAVLDPPDQNCLNVAFNDLRHGNEINYIDDEDYEFMVAFYPQDREKWIKEISINDKAIFKAIQKMTRNVILHQESGISSKLLEFLSQNNADFEILDLNDLLNPDEDEEFDIGDPEY